MLTSEYVNYLQGMIMSNYILGKEDPEYIIDAGSGEWCGAGHFSEQLYHYKCYLEQLVEGSFYLKYRYPLLGTIYYIICKTLVKMYILIYST